MSPQDRPSESQNTEAMYKGVVKLYLVVIQRYLGQGPLTIESVFQQWRLKTKVIRRRELNINLSHFDENDKKHATFEQP